MSLLTITDGSGYTTASKVRAAYGITATTDIGDTDLGTIIKYASRRLARDIARRVFNAKLIGVIDGTNAVFQTPDAYLADRNIDASVTAADVDVFGVTYNADGTLTRATLTVSSIDAVGGKVTLSAAPATTYSWLEAHYETYSRPVYLDDLEDAANALTMHMVYVRNRDPSKVTLAQLKGGSLGTEMAGGKAIFSTGSRFLFEYRECVQAIVTGVRGAPTTKPNQE